MTQTRTVSHCSAVRAETAPHDECPLTQYRASMTVTPVSARVVDAPVYRSYRVAIGGLPYFGRRMAALLAGEGWQAAYLETRGWRPAPALAALRAARRADVLYQLGGQIERLSRPDALRAVASPLCVMHWTGSDVLYAHTVARRGRVSRRLRDGCVHWAGAPWLVEELATIGVQATWVPHSEVAALSAIPPLPDGRFTVLAYLRPGREQFYGAEAVLRVAATLPEAEILIAGCERLPSAPANVRCLGWVERMDAVYARCHVLLRMAAHDGLAFMVQEALAFGRHVVWNYPFPGAHLAADAEEACTRVTGLAAQHERGTLSLNLAGAAHVRERYNPTRIRDDIRRRLAAVIEAGP